MKLRQVSGLGKISNSFYERLGEYARLTERELDRLLPEDDREENTVVQAMRYSLLGGGKRLRAALLLEFCRAACGEYERALPFACGVEMVHAYSLIHDDLPCMDDDDFRRGKLSCHKMFGEATALLAGDALLTKAFSVMLRSGAPAEVKVRAAACLADSIGEHGMIGGQIIDLANESSSAPLESVQRAYLLKTACLLRASAVIGAELGGMPPEFLEYAGKYALYTGLAFQIFDDILDVVGEEEKVGKPIGSDQLNQKTTYVTLYSLPKAREIAENYIRQAKEQLSCMNIQQEWLLEFADLVICRER